MRLIDADKLVLHLNDYALQEAPFGRNDGKNQKEIYETIKECMKAVEEQPTAFDVENVVSNLEQLKLDGACEDCGYCECLNECYLVDSDTICQYTGLTDKKGRKIWENDIIKYHYGDYYAPVKFGEYQSCFDSTTTCHVGFYVDWDEKRDFRKDLGYWIKMVDAEVVGNIHDKSEQQKDQRSTIICRDFMKKGRE